MAMGARMGATTFATYTTWALGVKMTTADWDLEMTVALCATLCWVQDNAHGLVFQSFSKEYLRLTLPWSKHVFNELQL